jgi:hypothetical protein
MIYLQAHIYYCFSTDEEQTACPSLIASITLDQSKILNQKKYNHEKANNLNMPVCCP